MEGACGPLLPRFRVSNHNTRIQGKGSLLIFFPVLLPHALQPNQGCAPTGPIFQSALLDHLVDYVLHFPWFLVGYNRVEILEIELRLGFGFPLQGFQYQFFDFIVGHGKTPPDQLLVLELGRLPPRGISKPVVVDQMMAEGYVTLLEEPLPTNPFCPFPEALIFASVLGVHVDYVLYRFDRGVPTRGLVGDEWNDHLGELRLASPVGELAAHQNGYSTANLVCKRHRRAHGVAVSAEHTTFRIDFKGLEAGVCLCGLNRRGRTGRDCKREFAQLIDPLTVYHGRLAVDSQDGYVRAVNCSAHVQAARQRDPNGGGEFHLPELIVKGVHYGLDHAGSIDRGSVAVGPSLCMNDVGNTSAGSSDRELV